MHGKSGFFESSNTSASGNEHWKKKLLNEFWLTVPMLSEAFPESQAEDFEKVYQNLQRINSFASPYFVRDFTREELIILSGNHKAFLTVSDKIRDEKKLLDLVCLCRNRETIDYILDNCRVFNSNLFNLNLNDAKQAHRFLKKLASSGSLDLFVMAEERIMVEIENAEKIIHAAAGSGNLPLFTHVIDLYRTSYERMEASELLGFAGKSGNPEMIDYCINTLKIPVEAKPGKPWLLYAAINSAKPEAIRYCIDKLDFRPQFSKTKAVVFQPICRIAHWANMEDMKEIIRMLSLTAADASDITDCNALEYALLSGNKEKIAYCLNELKLDPQRKAGGMNLLHRILAGFNAFCNLNMIQYCVEQLGLDPDAISDNTLKIKPSMFAIELPQIHKWLKEQEKTPDQNKELSDMISRLNI